MFRPDPKMLLQDPRTKEVVQHLINKWIDDYYNDIRTRALLDHISILEQKVDILTDEIRELKKMIKER